MHLMPCESTGDFTQCCRKIVLNNSPNLLPKFAVLINRLLAGVKQDGLRLIEHTARGKRICRSNQRSCAFEGIRNATSDSESWLKLANTNVGLGNKPLSVIASSLVRDLTHRLKRSI
jgi:hypothetical protein